jgi:hypothetical protein
MAAEAPRPLADKPAVETAARKVAAAAPLRERLARMERPQSAAQAAAERD